MPTRLAGLPWRIMRHYLDSASHGVSSRRPCRAKDMPDDSGWHIFIIFTIKLMTCGELIAQEAHRPGRLPLRIGENIAHVPYAPLLPESDVRAHPPKKV